MKRVYVVTGPRDDWKEVSTRIEKLVEKKLKWDPENDIFLTDHDYWEDWKYDNEDTMELLELADSVGPLKDMDLVIFAKDYYNHKFCNAVFFIATLYGIHTLNEDQLEMYDRGSKFFTIR